MDDTQGQIAELFERVNTLGDTVVKLTDQILKLEETLDTIASYIVPEDTEQDD